MNDLPIDVVRQSWKRDPSLVASGSERSGVHAAVWGCEQDIVREVGGVLADTHVVAVQLKPIKGETFIGGKLRFDRPTPAGALNIVRAGEATRVLIDGPYSMLHLYLPSSIIVEAAGEELSAPQEVDLVCPKLAGDPIVAQIGREVLREVYDQPHSSRLRIDALGLELAVHLVRHHSNIGHARSRPTARGGLAPWQERRATEYLDDHVAESITLPELAAVANLSPFHFARQFKQSTGLPPYAYLRRLRCEKAKQLLVSTELSIGHVAAAVGYLTPQAFARAFRAEVGASPSEYRRQRTT